MKSFNVIFKMSICKILHTPTIYVSLIVALIVNAFAFVFIPLSIYGLSMSTFYESDSFCLTTMQASFVVFAFVSALIGESNSINNEKIYFLSKSIKRSAFLLAKVLSSISMALVVCFVASFYLIIITIYEKVRWDNNMFNWQRGVNPLSTISSYLMIIIYAATLSTIWKYNFRSGVTIVILTLIVLLYVLIYPSIKPMGDEDFDDFNRTMWVTIPAIALIPITFALTLGGWILFLRRGVES